MAGLDVPPVPPGAGIRRCLVRHGADRRRPGGLHAGGDGLPGPGGAERREPVARRRRGPRRSRRVAGHGGGRAGRGAACGASSWAGWRPCSGVPWSGSPGARRSSEPSNWRAWRSRWLGPRWNAPGRSSSASATIWLVRSTTCSPTRWRRSRSSSRRSATVVEAEPDTSSAVREQLERTRHARARGTGRGSGRGPGPARRRRRRSSEQLTELSAQQHAAFTDPGHRRPLPAPKRCSASTGSAQEALHQRHEARAGRDDVGGPDLGRPRPCRSPSRTMPPAIAAPTSWAERRRLQGLRGIAERLELLGGEVESGPTASGLARQRVGAASAASSATGPSAAARVVRVLIADDQGWSARAWRPCRRVPDTEVVGSGRRRGEALELVAAASSRRGADGPAHAAHGRVDATRAVRERLPGHPGRRADHLSPTTSRSWRR